MRPTELLSKLVKGEVYQHSVTIPEGYNVVQIADILDQKDLANKHDILRLNQDAAFIASLNIQASTLEGYLFPDTYRFARYTPPEFIVQSFVSRFHEMVTPELHAQAKSMGMTLQEVLTLASVIEKETGLATERSLVSGVFHNRLQRNIPLQSDPTVIYALKYFDGNIRKADLSVNSPYNTYKVRGLPPGPIANPGLASIQAALYPTPSDFVYFVSRNDGSHISSQLPWPNTTRRSTNINGGLGHRTLFVNLFSTISLHDDFRKTSAIRGGRCLQHLAPSGPMCRHAKRGIWYLSVAFCLFKREKFFSREKWDEN